MEPDRISLRIKQKARELGFSLVGICPAVAPPGASRLEEWLARGYAGQMEYLELRREAYAHPRHILEGVRSLVMLAMPYGGERPRAVAAGEGKISRYAWGSIDYHDLIREKLHQLADFLRIEVPEAVTRGVVDTAPLLEREFASLAGLGWVGKNTLLINRQVGSYFFLAALLTDQLLRFDTAHLQDHCGTCTACLDACPTAAFAQPYVLDATKCISYLTIELRDAVPLDLRERQGEWLFGCDVCQEVCPWNRFAPTDTPPQLRPLDDRNPIELTSLFAMNDEQFRRRFRHSALWRAHRRGLLRSAAIVLGNQKHEPAIDALVQGLNDDDPIVRGASAWALGRIGSPLAVAELQKRIKLETNEEVSREIELACRDDPR
jgi:epoxyqueuosine reductase